MKSSRCLTTSYLQAMALGVLCVLLQAALANSNSCGCQNHPQQLVCRADFVIKGKILSKSETEEFHRLFGQRQIISYEVNVTTIFKGIDLIETNTQIIRTTAGRSQPCGYPGLDIGEKYLLTGSLKENELWSEDCQWNERWVDLEANQVRGLTNEVYTENCDCQISSLALRKYKTGKPIYSGGDECYFKDAHGQYMVKKLSCIRGCGRTLGCSWVRNDNYEECFNVNKLSDLRVRNL